MRKGFEAVGTDGTITGMDSVLLQLYRMRAQRFRLIGLSVFLLGTLIWLMGGARSGFTNTSIEKMEIDEITELEITRHEDGWEPGIEFIAAGFLGLSLLVAASVIAELREKG